MKNRDPRTARSLTHVDFAVCTGEYQFTMKSYKIPMKKPCPSTAIAIPPVPGTEDVILAPNAAESPTKPSHTETYTSPLAALDPPPPKPASVSQPIGHATNNSAPAQQPAKPATNKRPSKLHLASESGQCRQVTEIDGRL